MKLPQKQVAAIDHLKAGQSVRKERKRKQVSLRQLAVKLELSAPFLSDLERGKRNWTPERFQQAQQAINFLSTSHAK